MLLNDKIEVHVFKGTEYKVEVIAGENIIKNISTRVQGGLLTIENHNTCNFVRGYKHVVTVNVTAPYIKSATNQGVSTMSFEDFVQDTLVLKIENSGDVRVNGTFNQVRTSTHGNGDFYLTGSANSFFVYAYGTNYIRAQDFTIRDYAFVETLTIGDCYLNATGLGLLEYNIHSEGNIYYTGQPAVIHNFSDGNAKGKAEKRDQ